jgi:hypothetical protein
LTRYRRLVAGWHAHRLNVFQTHRLISVSRSNASSKPDFSASFLFQLSYRLRSRIAAATQRSKAAAITTIVSDPRCGAGHFHEAAWDFSTTNSRRMGAVVARLRMTHADDPSMIHCDTEYGTVLPHTR